MNGAQCDHARLASLSAGRGARAQRSTVLAGELTELLRRDGPGTWSELAACRDQLDDVMFPEGDEGSAVYQRGVEAARAVCAWCPVRALCLDHALRVGEDEGVWGGTTPGERRALRQTEEGA